jgi:hypothetical protein
MLVWLDSFELFAPTDTPQGMKGGSPEMKDASPRMQDGSREVKDSSPRTKGGSREAKGCCRGCGGADGRAVP